MGSFERMEQVVIAHGHRFGLETEAAEVADSYPGKTVQDSVAAVPRDSVGKPCSAVAVAAAGLVAEYSLAMPVIRMGYKKPEDMFAAAAEPALVRLKHQRDW